MRLTKRAIDAAKPRASRYAIWDSELRGFGCMIHPPSRRHPAGSKVYVLRYFAAGADRRMKLGAHGELTPDQARKLAAESLVRVRSGEDPLAARQELRQAPTVAEAFSGFLNDRKGRWKPSTLGEVTRIYQTEIKSSALAGRRIATVRRAEVAR